MADVIDFARGEGFPLKALEALRDAHVTGKIIVEGLFVIFVLSTSPETRNLDPGAAGAAASRSSLPEHPACAEETRREAWSVA